MYTVLHVSEEFRKEFEDTLRRLEERFKALVNDVENLNDKGEVREANRLWRERSREIIKEFRESLEKLEKMSESIDEKSFEAIANDLKKRVEEVVDSIKKSFEKLSKRFRALGACVVITIPGVE